MKRILLAAALLAATVVAHAAVIGGNITVAPTLTPLALNHRSDGGFDLLVGVGFNGASRLRYLGISSDGTAFTLDGVATSTMPALTLLGTATVNYGTRVTAVLSAPGVQALLVAP